MNKEISSGEKTLRLIAIICSIVMLALCVMKIMPRFHVYAPRLPLLLIPAWSLIFSLKGGTMNKKLYLVFPALLIMELVFSVFDNKLLGGTALDAFTGIGTWLQVYFAVVLVLYALGLKNGKGAPLISDEFLLIGAVIWAVCSFASTSVFRSFSGAFGNFYGLLMLPGIFAAVYPRLAAPKEPQPQTQE